MKIIVTQLLKKSRYAGISDPLSYLLLLLLPVIATFLPNSAFSANENASLLLSQQTRVMVTTPKYDQMQHFLRQVQLDVMGFYWNAQNGVVEIQKCSGETTLLSNAATATLEIDAFDATLGTLSEVEIALEGTLMANADEDLATGTEYMLALNSTLMYQLPGNPQDSLAVSNKHNMRTYNEYMGQQGFQLNGWQLAEARKTINAQLNLFQGTGKVQIPIEGKDLIDFTQGQSHITSTLKVKACVTYRYQ